MSKNPTKQNCAEGITGNSSANSNNCFNNIMEVEVAETGNNKVMNSEKTGLEPNAVQKTKMANMNMKKEQGVAETTKEAEKVNVKVESNALVQVKEEIVEIDQQKELCDKNVTSKKKTDRKKEKKVSEKKIEKTNERKSERKRGRRGMGFEDSSLVDAAGDGSNTEKVNFIRGSKFKSVDIYKKLLVVKSDEDLKKVIDKEDVTEEDMRHFKEELEKTNTVEEKKKRNIIIPGVQTCENYNYITTKFQRPAHYIRYELYRDQVSGIRLNDGTIIHYDMLKEDELFLQKLNENIKTFVSDDDFSKLIDRFEKTTGKWVDGSEEINYKDALEIAEELKLNYKNHIIKEIYAYWKKRRKALGKPLLRMLWANCHHNLPNYVVFRPKVKEKMTLRKHKKKNLDTIIKMHKLLEDFRRIDKILKKMRQRDEKKLLLIQLNAILFDQRKNEIIDRTYVCPMWNYFKDYKMEKIYKRFKKDKYYKNVYTNSITNNNATATTANNTTVHNASNTHGENALDKVRGMKKGLCGMKIDPFFFTYPLRPVEYENVVLIKRRGRNNRIWIDRKLVSEYDESPHKLTFFKEEDAKEIIKCCDVSEYFPDYFDKYSGLSKRNSRTCKDAPKKLEKETINNITAFAASSSMNSQKNELKEVNKRNGIDEREKGGEDGQEKQEDMQKKGSRKRVRGKSVEKIKDLEVHKKIKLEGENLLEKNGTVSAIANEETCSSIVVSEENYKNAKDAAAINEFNGALMKLSSNNVNATEKQGDNDTANILALSNINATDEKETADGLANTLVQASKNDMNETLPNVLNTNTSSSSSIITSQMEYTFNLFKKHNRSLFQLEEVMDPVVNRENSLLSLNKYAHEQKKILFYLENVLDFDNFNFEHNKKRRKAPEKTAAKGGVKEAKRDSQKGTEKKAEEGTKKGADSKGKGKEKETEKGREKNAQKNVEKGTSRGTVKGNNKNAEKNTEKTTNTSRIKKEVENDATSMDTTAHISNISKGDMCMKEVTQKCK